MQAASMPAPATAQTEPSCLAQDGCVRTSAARLFALADRMIADGQPVVATRILIALQGDPSIDVRSEARFRLARLMESQGDFSGAIAQYRAILSDDPKAGSVRLALARALARSGAPGRASVEVRLARSFGVPPEVAQAVDRFATVLRSAQRSGGAIEMGGVLSSNINRAIRRTTISVGGLDFTLTPDAMGQSGRGVYGRGQAFWRPRLAGDLNLLASASATADTYQASRFDDVAGVLALGPELVRNRGRIQATAQLTQRWFGGRRYSNSYGADLTAIVAVGSSSRIELTGQIAQVRYAALHAQSGLQAGGSLALERKLSGHVSTRLTIRADHAKAKAAAFTNWTYGGAVLISRTFGRAFGYATVAHYRTDGAASLAFPPETRRDRYWQGEIGLQLAPIARGRLTPVLRLRRAANRSPVFFYRYTEDRAELGFSHQF